MRSLLARRVAVFFFKFLKLDFLRYVLPGTNTCCIVRIIQGL